MIRIENKLKMGSKCSTIQLADTDIEEIEKETGFSASQVKRLYSRFSSLDKENNAFLKRCDLMRIPELAINPLAERIVESFFVQHSIDGVEEGINFRQFVAVLARFRRQEGHKPHPLNTSEDKLEYAFKMYDIDNMKKITKENLCYILSFMVGTNKSNDQLIAIADRTMLEADLNKDGFIDFREFKQALERTDFQSKMSIRFLD